MERGSITDQSPTEIACPPARRRGDGEACRPREIAGRRVEGNRITTSYAKLIDSF